MIEGTKRSYRFSTKANTLLLLHDKLHHAFVLDIVVFTVGEFISSQSIILNKIQSAFFNQTIIIRSSAKAEDGDHRTLAGHFKSVLNVDSRNSEEVIVAINKVISSYACENYYKTKLYRQQIFVQRQVQADEIEIAGVAFSYDPHSQAPYFFINYESNGSTDAVTNGSCSKSIYLYRNYGEYIYPWDQLINALKEIEKIFSCKKIDVEFAVLKDKRIIIFQARKLNTRNRFPNLDSYDKLIKKSFTSIKNCNDIFSDMSFWNPAEMIGREPHPLDYSLYANLITNKAWNEGLVRMGYSFVDSPLMIQIGNHPYISIRKAVNSLLPNCLSEGIKDLVVKHCLDYIRENPSSHDKIEFEVVHNCAYLGLKEDLRTAYNYILSNAEITDYYNALYNITRDLILNYSNTKTLDLYSLNNLRIEQLRFKTIFSNTEGVYEILEAVNKHIKAISSYISSQFAFHARCAFISKKLLNSLVDAGYMSGDDLNEFISNIPTIVTDFLDDMGNSKVNEEELADKYGHLRNSTYDILSKKYSDIGINKLRGYNLSKRNGGSNNIKISTFLEPLSGFFSCQISEIKNFIISSIQMRELLKFEYSRSVSLILDSISVLAKKLSLSLDEIAFVSLDDLLKINPKSSNEQLSSKLKNIAKHNEYRYKKYHLLLYPSVITGLFDCYAIKVYSDRPNFITNKTIVADAILCTDKMLNENIDNLDLNNKIVILEKAEPGNDWIFSKYKIAGLIAKYGGAGSHMAIRCLEQGIPAALGCGERIFRYISESMKVLLDCKNEIVSRIS